MEQFVKNRESLTCLLVLLGLPMCVWDEVDAAAAAAAVLTREGA